MVLRKKCLDINTMKLKKFEDIIAWQKAQNLAVSIYSLFGNIDDYGFRNQICRATVSISNNIAEGFDRISDKEFRRYLFIAKGSCSEVKSMLYLSQKLKMIDNKTTDSLIEKCNEISKIIRGLINYLES